MVILNVFRDLAQYYLENKNKQKRYENKKYILIIDEK